MLDDNLRKRFKIESTVQGIVVIAVDPASEAAQKRRIEPGDVITQADQREARLPQGHRRSRQELEGRGATSIFLLILEVGPAGRERFIALKLKG